MPILDSGARQTALLAHLCKGLFASYQQQFFVGVGGARVKCMGRLVKQNRVKVHKQASKRFQMDVGMSSISVYKLRIQEVTTALSNNKVHKQGELGTSHFQSSAWSSSVV